MLQHRWTGLSILLIAVASVASLNGVFAVISTLLYNMRRAKLMSIIESSTARLGIIAKALKSKRGRKARRFWTRPGRTNKWWKNLKNGLLLNYLSTEFELINKSC